MLTSAILSAGEWLDSRHRAANFEFRSVTELVESIEPSVVQIETNNGLGSGFVLDETGLIVTCYHCIEDAHEAEVIFDDGRRATVIGVCKTAPELDLAIVSIQAPRRLAALPLVGQCQKRRAHRGIRLAGRSVFHGERGFGKRLALGSRVGRLERTIRRLAPRRQRVLAVARCSAGTDHVFDDARQ